MAFPIIPLILTVASGVLAASSARNAGIAQNQEYKAAARQEKDAARQQEIDKRRKLLLALSSQNAQAGAQGVSTARGTGKAALMQKDIDDNREDLLTDTVNTKRKQNLMIAKGRNAQRTGEVNAISSLLDTAAKSAKIVG
jgi:hypothetical protein